MPNPTGGVVRAPTGSPTQADLEAAIASASAKYGVPADVLRTIWQRETSGTIDANQVVVYNTSGYGGLFGLPRNLLGSIQEQADHAASLLAGYNLPWDAAVQKYSGGAYGYSGNAGTPPGPPLFGLDQATYDKITTLLDQLALGFSRVDNRETGASAAEKLKAAFPDVPVPTLRAIANYRGSNPDIGAYFGNTFGGGGPADAKNAVTSFTQQLDAAKNTTDVLKSLLAPANWWRLGFVAVGGVLVISGARIYMAPSGGGQSAD